MSDMRRNARRFPSPLWGGVRGGGRDTSGVSACRNRADDRHSPTPTPSAGAADPPPCGEGMQANDLNDCAKRPHALSAFRSIASCMRGSSLRKLPWVST